MPWSSKAQARWGHTAEGKKALGGEAGVHEWDEATEGKKLPEKIEKSLSTSVPSGMKMPKPKKMATALDKPSKFFKSETKHSSIQKLENFLNAARNK